MKILPRNWLLLSSLVFLSTIYKSQTFQNLVPNGSYESFTLCPTNTTKIHYAPPWSGPTTDETGYLNACSQSFNVPHYGGPNTNFPAKTGVAYVEMFVFHSINGQSFRNYAQVELTDTLKSSSCYYVEFYASNLQWIKYRTNNISACFTPFALQTNLVSPGIIPNIQPHITNFNNPVLPDTVSWQKISGVYEAIGGEKFITIGNFKDNAHTDTVNIYPKGSYAYSGLPSAVAIFIDAVSVFSLNPSGTLPWSYRDTTIKKGDSVYIGNKMGGLHFAPQWYKQNGAYIKTNAGITVSPTITSKYYVQYTFCGVQRTDTVKVTVLQDNDVAIIKLKMMNEGLKIYPQPADEMLNVECKMMNENTKYSISIVNNLGQVIKEEEIVFKEKKAAISMKDLEEGVYVLKLNSNNSVPASIRFVIAR